MDRKLLLRGLLSIYKYPIFSLVCNSASFLPLRRDIGRYFRRIDIPVSKFEAFCRVLQNENISSILRARLYDHRFAYRLFSIFFKSNPNIEILTPPSNIGPGLIVYHHLGAVIRAKQIGADVTISQGVTVGAGGGWDNNDSNNIPTIGNRVLIATNAIVIGNVTIGDDAIIGAGAVITKDVPPGVVVVGNPQRIIKQSADCR